MSHRLLSERGRANLRAIIAYRNYPTGVGTVHFGPKVAGKKVKVRGAIQNILSADLSQILRKLVKRGKSDPIFLSFFKLCNSIMRIQGKVKDGPSPEISIIISGLSDVAEISRRSLVPEGETLDYLRMIDSEIDSILKIFDLNKHSRI